MSGIQSGRWSSVSLLALLLPIAWWTPSVVAQQADAEAADDSASKADENQAGEPEKRFAVPDGTPEQLFVFINEVKRTRPQPPLRTRDEMLTFLNEQINAVVDAADRILESNPDEEIEIRAIQEKFSALGALARYDSSAGQRLKDLANELADDERPAIQKLAGAELLKARGANASDMSESEQQAFLSDLFAFIDTHGMDRSTYAVAAGIARGLSYGDADTAASVYEKLAAAMANSDDLQLSDGAAKMLGAARRLRLPGSFMDLKGVTADGEPFDWAQYRGKVVLVDFWASWCGPCRAEVPNMKANLEKYGDTGFAIVGINLDQTAEARQKYIDKEELTWTNLVAQNDEEAGWNHPMADYYGISGIPTAILVDKDGKVISLRARGGELDRLLVEQLGPVEEPEEKQSDNDS